MQQLSIHKNKIIHPVTRIVCKILLKDFDACTHANKLRSTQNPKTTTFCDVCRSKREAPTFSDLVSKCGLVFREILSHSVDFKSLLLVRA